MDGVLEGTGGSKDEVAFTRRGREGEGGT
jgi:hypothetical protein